MNFTDFGRRFPPSKFLLLTCLVTPVVLASRAIASILRQPATESAATEAPDLDAGDQPITYPPIDPNSFFMAMQALKIEVLEPNERHPIKGPWVIFEPGCFDRFEGDQKLFDTVVSQLESELIGRIEDGELIGPVIVRGHKGVPPEARAKSLN